MDLDNIDDFGLYDDLDEFHEKEEKKSKELLALENKYQEALKTIEAMNMEKKDLRKKIRLMEQNLQSLLDTAKAEIKRKDKIIDDLRKEKDDICFRRQHISQNLKHINEQCNAFEEPPSTSLTINVGPKKFEQDSKSKQNFCKRVPSVEKNKASDEGEAAEINNYNSMTQSNQNFRTNDHKGTHSQEFVGKNISKSDISRRKNDTNSKKDIISSQSASINERKYGDRHIGLYKSEPESLRRRNKDESRERYTNTKYENRKSSSRQSDSKERISRYHYDENISHRKHKNDQSYIDDKSHRKDRYEKESEKRDKSPKSNRKEDGSSRHKRLHDPYSDDDKERKRSRSSKDLNVDKQCTSEWRFLQKADLSHSVSPKFEDIESSDEDLGSPERKTVADKVNTFPGRDKPHNLLKCVLNPEKIKTADESTLLEKTESLEKKGETNQLKNSVERFSPENKSISLLDNCNRLNVVEKVLHVEEPADNIREKVVLLKDLKNISEEIIKRSEIQIHSKKLEIPYEELSQKTEKGLYQNESENVNKEITQTTETKHETESQKKDKEIIYRTKEKICSKNICEEIFQRIDREANINDTYDFVRKEVIKINENMYKKELDHSKDIDQPSEKKFNKELQNSNEKIISDTKSLNSNKVDNICSVIVKTIQKEVQCKDTKNDEEVKIKNSEINIKVANNFSESSDLSTEKTVCKMLDENNIHFKEQNSFDEKVGHSTEMETNKDIEQTEKLQNSNQTKNKIFSEAIDRTDDLSSFDASTSKGNVSLRREFLGLLTNGSKATPANSVQVVEKVTKEINGTEPNNVKNTKVSKTDEARNFSYENMLISNYENDKKILNTVSTNSVACDIRKFNVELNELETLKIERSNLKERVEDIQENYNNESKEFEALKELKLHPNCTNNDNEQAKLRSSTLSLSGDTSTEPKFQSDENDEKGTEVCELSEHEQLVYISEKEMTSPSPNAFSSPNDKKDMYIEKAKNVIIIASIQTENDVLKLVENSLESEIQKNQSEEICNEGLDTPLKKASNLFQQAEVVSDKIHQVNPSLQLATEKLEIKSPECEQPETSSLVKPLEIIEKRDLILNRQKVETSLLHEMNNENDNLWMNLSQSSDEGEETLAEIQKRCKLQRKEKIEILENVCLSTLFSPIIRSTGKDKNSPEKCVVPIKTNEILKEEPKNISEKLNSESKNCDSLAKNYSEIGKSKDGLLDLINNKVNNSFCDLDKKTNKAHIISNLINIKTNENTTKENLIKENDWKKNQIQISAMHFNEMDCFIDTKNMENNLSGFPSNETEKSSSINEKSHGRPLNDSLTFSTHNAHYFETSKQQSPIKKPKNIIKSKVSERVKEKERRSLTDLNGDMAEDNNSNTKLLKSSTKVLKKSSELSNILRSPENISEKTTIHILTKKLSPSSSRITKKCSNKPNKLSPSKNTKPNSIMTPTKNLIKKRKRSPNTTFSPKSSKSALKLSTSAEVRAMLIDEKSPKITNDILETSPLSAVQDTNLDELDKDMQAIFDSPAKCNYDSMLCGSSSILDATIDQSIVTSSNQSENLNKTQDSSFESKRLSLGTSQYVYERVSENVVNLFITRRRNKKHTKSDTTIKQSNVERM